MDVSSVLSPAFWMAAGVMVLAGWVKGIAGMGLPSIGMAFLAIFMTPAEAAAMLVMPTVLTNFWQVRPLARLPALWKRVGSMQWTLVLGTLLTAYWLGAPLGVWSGLALGLSLVLYALWGLTGAQLSVPPQAERYLSPLVGYVNGSLTAITGVSAMPAVPYLQALGLQRDDLIQALGVLFSISTVALGVSLWFNGVLTVSVAGLSVLLFLPALLGMWLGERYRQRLSPALFRRYFLMTLVLLGGYQVIKGVLSL